MVCATRLATELRPESRRPATVLFNDVEDSTRLAESFEPETLRRIMSRYFDVVADVCGRHGGTVEKFIGDAAMAVFGIPTALEDHALRAVRAAVELKEELDALNEELTRSWGVRIATRTGVNSGEVVAGDPAGGQALVTGDAVNVAARLEQSAGPGETLIGEATHALVASEVEAEPVGPLTAKGRDEQLTAWRLLDVTSRVGQPVRPAAARMLGRDPELAELRDRFERVLRARAAHRVTVVGPAGIGKSRLAQEFVRVIGDGAEVLVGSSPPYGEGVTFSPLAEIVRQAAGDDPRKGISRLLGDDPHAELIAERVCQAIGLSEEPDAGRDLPWAVRRLLETLARRTPVVAVFEDVHWAEPPLLELIEYLTENARAPLMLLCLAREDLLDERPVWAETGPSVSTIALDPLGDREVGALVDELVAAAPPGGEDVRARIVERAGGNPLFVEQMLALLSEQASEELTIPPTIQALLAARLDRLPAAERELIGTASVVGSEFWPAAVRALSEPDAVERVPQMLDALGARDLIHPDTYALTGDDGYAFHHALIRDAAYGSLTKQRRAELHERFANWLEDAHRERLAELEAIIGHHLERAHGYRVELAPPDERSRALARRASTRLGSAGRRSARVREDATAVSLLSRASALLPEQARERLELLPLLGESLEGTADHVKAGEVYAEALKGALATGDRWVEGLARLGNAHVWFVAEPERSMAEILAEGERAVAILEEVGDQRGLAEALRLVGEAKVYDGKAEEGQRALERALERLGAEGDPRSLNAISFALGQCLLDGPAPLGEAVTFAEERLALARDRLVRSFEADMLHLLGLGEGRRGNFERAREALADSAGISEELGLKYMAQWSRRSMGHVELLAGDAVAAERALRASYRVLEEMGLKSSLGEAAVPLAEALLEQGRREEAAEMLETVKEDWASGDVSVEAPRLAVRAKVLAAQGWDKHAERAAERALRLVRRTDWACLRADALLARALVLMSAGREAEASASLGEAVSVAASKEYSALERRANELLARLRSEAAGRALHSK
jgi:class 3 adenylate cyclase/tetratricopeptide (TPR) repeat protein